MDLQWLEGGELPTEDLDGLTRSLAFHLKRLVDERDTQFEVGPPWGGSGPGSLGSLETYTSLLFLIIIIHNCLDFLNKVLLDCLLAILKF